MATVTLRDENRTLSDAEAISEFLGRYGIWYRRFERIGEVPAGADDDALLAAFHEPIRALMREGGYRTADVISVRSDTPNLQAMLDKFNKEHWHDEDEVRFVVEGRGLFHIHPENEPVFSIEVVKGDMINVPRGTHHWFDLCDEREIRCIRLFQHPAGWSPHYTGSKKEAAYQPLCLGPAYLPPTR